jgi:hypothetical protein
MACEVAPVDPVRFVSPALEVEPAGHPRVPSFRERRAFSCSCRYACRSGSRSCPYDFDAASVVAFGSWLCHETVVPTVSSPSKDVATIPPRRVVDVLMILS